MLNQIQAAGRAAFLIPRRVLDESFGGTNNPLRHLGSLTIFFLWIVLVSGIWLFIFFHTSVEGAYDSVEYLTHSQWYFGGVMRSLHRYASDAAVITLVLHVFKEFSFDSYRGPRWFSWLTGVPLVWLLIPLGITGYWLVWDQLAHYVALTSAQLLDWLPIFTDSMARNFLSDEDVSDRFFTLMAFLHLIGLPIFLVFGIWLHVFRINGPAVNPPRVLMGGALLCMLVVSLVFPAVSQERADLAQVPEQLGLDWYYLLVYPLVQSWSPGAVWALLASVSLLICLAPWLPPARPPRPARVDLENCNGCERCVDDCPFGAVNMAPRSDGLKYEREAVVDADLCTRCGICVGACPTATPFRTRSALSPGIDLPDHSAARLQETLRAASLRLSGRQRIMVFGCQTDSKLARLEDDHTAVVPLVCMGQLPPPFIDYILSRDLADGVAMAGCRGGDCLYRLGTQWTELRVARERDPHLRKRIDNRQVGLLWEQPWATGGDVRRALQEFRRSLPVSDLPEPIAAASGGRRRWLKIAGTGMAYALFGLLAWRLSAWPGIHLLEPGQAVVSLTFSHAGQRIEDCRILTQDELNKLPPNMRKPADCPRERWPVEVFFSVDGQNLLEVELAPSGIWNDGKSSLYRRIPVAAGRRSLFVGMRDSGPGEGFDVESEAQVGLHPGQHLLVEFDTEHRTFRFR